MNREDLIKFIPKPKNEDVIVYDISLNSLIDINVLEEYNKLYPIFINNRNKYLDLKNKIKIFNDTIDNIYLYDPSWDEKTYIEMLQKNKKTYATLYNDIKKIENNIDMLKKKISAIDEKIQIQIAKEDREINNKRANIDNEIKTNKEKLLKLREKYNDLKSDKDSIINKINDNEEEFQLLSTMESEITKGEYKCKYCGSTVKVYSENSLIYKRLYKNIENNKKELLNLQKKQEKIDLDLAYYENEILNTKSILNNDIEFKKQDYNFYHKKSLEVLKLEALKDEMINNMSNMQKQLKLKPQINSTIYLDLKDKINKYELSLNNLNKIKEMKLEFNKTLDEYNQVKKILKENLETINLYLKFLSIYYKIYEQKANEYFGPDFKFKIFKIEDYKIINVFEIYYKGLSIEQLSEKDREFVEKTFIEKINIFN
ncbi:MAG: hypothetical protein ACI31S_01555 [Bacilli bacterium]